MGYSNYQSLKLVTKKFDLVIKKTNLLSNIRPIEPSTWLKKSVELAHMIPLSNEKAKSERLISPILTEVHTLHKDKLTLFSGEELNVEPENDLNGPCDFFFSAKPESYLLEAPIVAFTEAKDEKLDYGIAQCVAQMIGAQKYNQAEGEAVETIWGCSTTADVWKFLKLTDKTLYIDLNNFYLDKLDVLLGAFYKILEEV